MASRAIRYACSSRNPCRTSCTTGRHVTTSSKSTIASRRRPGGLWNTSLQMEVSPSTTAACPVDRAVLADHGQVAFPLAGSCQLQDAPRLRPPHEVLQGALDGPG